MNPIKCIAVRKRKRLLGFCALFDCSLLWRPKRAQSFGRANAALLADCALRGEVARIYPYLPFIPRLLTGRRWARSTMVLVPLFGTQYALSLVFSASIKQHGALEMVWIMLDQTFASFQVSTPATINVSLQFWMNNLTVCSEGATT